MSSIKNTELEGSLSVGRNVTAGGGATIQGSVTIAKNLKVSGWLDAKNVKGPSKGLFTSVESLKEAYPHPHEGWWALVGTTLPAELYVVDGGEWVDTGETAGEVTVDSQAYEEQVEELSGQLEELASDLQSALDSEATTRAAADTALQSALDSEATTRAAADTALQASITSLEQDITNDVGELNELIVDLHATVSLAASKTIIEKGVSASVTFTGTASFNNSTELVTGMSLYQTTSTSGTSVASSTTSPLTYTATLSDTMTYTLLATIGGVGKTATRTVNAYYPIYLLASADTPTASTITGGTKQTISSTAAGSRGITTSDGDYVWLCVPSGVTVPTSATMSGFDCPITTTGTVSGVSVNGASVTYTLVRTTNTMKADTLTIVYS